LPPRPDEATQARRYPANRPDPNVGPDTDRPGSTFGPDTDRPGPAFGSAAGRPGSGFQQWSDPDQPAESGRPGQFGRPAETESFPAGGGRPSLAAWAAGSSAGSAHDRPHDEDGTSDAGQDPAPPAPKRRRGLLIGAGVAVVLLLLAAAGVVITMKLNSSTTYAVGDCVQQDGSSAKKVSCGDQGAFAVVSKVDKQEKCPDPNQPFVVLKPDGGKEEVLCLRPAAQK